MGRLVNLESMSTEALLFNLKVLAEIETNKAFEAGDYTRETAFRYRAAVIREAIKRLEQEL